MIKEIVFDIGGVIFPDLHEPVVGEIAAKLGVPSEEALTIYDRVEQKFQYGKGPFNEVWLELNKVARNKVTTEEL